MEEIMTRSNEKSRNENVPQESRPDLQQPLGPDSEDDRFEMFPDPSGRYVARFVSKDLVAEIEARAIQKARALIAAEAIKKAKDAVIRTLDEL
jgi:hypothetical protein